MLKEKDILTNLDNSVKQGYYCSFIDLGHAYSYLIDSRLNIFRGDNDRWVIAAERLGFNPRGGAILLDIYYFGNRLINLEHYNEQDTNWYSVSPIDWDNFVGTVDGEVVKPEAKYWIVRGEKVELSHDKQEYLNAGIELKEYEPSQISVEDAGRLLITKHRDLFRATDEELYKSIPADLKKIFVIDEWYHRDYVEISHPAISEDHLRYTYEFNSDNYYSLKGQDTEPFVDYESFAEMFRKGEQQNAIMNQKQWEKNRPSSYQTWKQIAKVIATGDTSHYKPTLKPNSHWKHWPDSGSL